MTKRIKLNKMQADYIEALKKRDQPRLIDYDLSIIEMTYDEVLEACVKGYDRKPEQKYYVHFLPKDEYGYLNRSVRLGITTLTTNNKIQTAAIQTKFTEREIKFMNPLFWEFRELVEDEVEK